MQDQNIDITPGSILNKEHARPTRKLVILGASGSIGSTTIAFIRKSKEISISGISVHSSITRLREILHEFKIERAAISSADIFDGEIQSLKKDFPRTIFYRGEDGLIELIEECKIAGADTVLTAVVGTCGIMATFRALALNMKIALANKESMVTAGPAIENYVTGLNQNNKNKNFPVILPVDSEHNAIFQLLAIINREHMKKIILTASGGPFIDLSISELEKVDRNAVLNHPTWKMGPKITVDSAGMINKGLEMIEAHFLFSLPYERLDVLIHRNSFVHGMIETADGSYLMAASQPDMVFPIAHALYYPDATPGQHDVATAPYLWAPLQFESLAGDKYPGFFLCMETAKRGGTGPAIFNGANETCVELFLEGKISFIEIPAIIDMVLSHIEIEQGTELELFLEADRRAKAIATEKALLVRN